MTNHLITSGVVFACMLLLFLEAQRRNDNSIVDIFWGPGFGIVALTSLLLSGTITGRGLLVTSLVLIWGIRLGVYIGLRNSGQGEDYRYRQMRKKWGGHPKWGAFFQVFLLQSVLMMLISLPVQMINLYPSGPLTLLDCMGVALWCVGFYFEAKGDDQLRRFKADPKNKGRIMRYGLWSLTRHPNYFGEIALWWGIFLIALSAKYWYISLVGPVLITFFLMKVSGVPMLERKYKNHPEYQEYIQRTPALFPFIK